MNKRSTKALWVKQLEAEAPIRAILGWAGAGNANDNEILSQEDIEALASSYAPNVQQVPVLVQHDWDVRSIIGTVTAVEIIDTILMATLDITDDEARAKIRSGEWSNVSIGYSWPDMQILEVSLVAIPAIRGARIVEKELSKMEENVTLSEMEQAELVEHAIIEAAAVPSEVDTVEAPGEVVTLDREQSEEVKTYAAKLEAAKAEIKELEESLNALHTSFNDVCDDNAALRERAAAVEGKLALASAVEDELRAQLRDNARLIKLESWVREGKSTPAQMNIEKKMCLDMSEEQFEMYSRVKGDSHKPNPFAGTVAKLEPNSEDSVLRAFREWRKH